MYWGATITAIITTTSLSTSSSIPHHHHPAPSPVLLLPIRQWNITETPDDDFIRNITEAKIPQHIRNSLAQRNWTCKSWGAKAWSFDLLSHMFMMNVSESIGGNAKFTRGCCEEHKKSSKQFFVDAIQGDKYKSEPQNIHRELKHFFARLNYERLPPEEKKRVSHGMTPEHALYVPDPKGVPIYTRPTHGQSREFLFSSARTILPFEMSDMHVFYYQIHGIVTATIYPPLWQNLYMFPKTHLRTRYSQVFSDDFNSSLFPNFTPAIESLHQRCGLESGDVLYVPPFHFLQLETISPVAVMVKISSPSYQVEKLHRIWNVEIPTLQSTNKIVEVAKLIRLVVGQVLGDGKIRFMQALITSRFSHVFAANPQDPTMGLVKTFHDKNEAWTEFRSLLQKQNNGQVSQQDFTTACQHRNRDDDDALMVKTSTHIVDIFKDYMESKWFDQNTMEIILGDWIEDVVKSLVGVKQMLTFMNACFGGGGGNSEQHHDEL